MKKYFLIGIAAYLGDAYRRYNKYAKAYPNDRAVIQNKQHVRNVKEAFSDLTAEAKAWTIRKKYDVKPTQK